MNKNYESKDKNKAENKLKGLQLQNKEFIIELNEEDPNHLDIILADLQRLK
jgi:hypothetical protein